MFLAYSIMTFLENCIMLYTNQPYTYLKEKDIRDTRDIRETRETRESKLRSLPNLTSEIKRVSALIVNKTLVAALARCDSLLARMSKIQTQLEKLKKGELYEWQKEGPAKSYEQFGGGDRIQGLLFSLKQNQ